MKIKSARQVWHDCTYAAARSTSASLEDLMVMGRMIQKTDRGNDADHAVHSVLAGHFQSAIERLHPQLRVFGEWMYSAAANDDIREAAEEVVFGLAASKAPRMTASKRERAEYVAKGVLYRYRYMHQGGQSANPDPMSKPETFRAWLFDEYGVRLESCAWARDWEPFIQLCFECCEDIDRKALSPVAALIYTMKEAA